MNVIPISHKQIIPVPELPESKIHLTIQELTATKYLEQNQGLFSLPLPVLDRIVSYVDENTAHILKITSISLRAVVRNNVQFEARFTISFFEYTSQKIVDGMKSSWDKKKSTQLIARGLAKRGQCNRALVYVKRSDYRQSKYFPETYGYIAKRQAAEGDHVGAVATIDSTIHDYPTYVATLTGIARMLAQKRDYKQALMYANKIATFEKLAAYSAISVEQVKRSDDEEAFRNIALLKNDPLIRFVRGKLYGVIALEQARRGDFDVALETAKQIKIDQKREEAIQQIARIRSNTVTIPNFIKVQIKSYVDALEQVKQKDFKGCLETIDFMAQGISQVEALQYFATVIYRTVLSTNAL